MHATALRPVVLIKCVRGEEPSAIQVSDVIFIICGCIIGSFLQSNRRTCKVPQSAYIRALRTVFYRQKLRIEA